VIEIPLTPGTPIPSVEVRGQARVFTTAIGAVAAIGGFPIEYEGWGGYAKVSSFVDPEIFIDPNWEYAEWFDLEFSSGVIPDYGGTTLDTDNDGIPDISDNCPLDPNTDQADADSNSIGDACDLLTDSDGDGIANNEDDDDDNDGLSDEIEINFLGTNPLLADSDANGILDGDEDSDGDGFTNLEEVQCDADPIDPSSRCVRFLPFLMLLLD
jgi:hypothetical protein